MQATRLCSTKAVIVVEMAFELVVLQMLASHITVQSVTNGSAMKLRNIITLHNILSYFLPHQDIIPYFSIRWEDL